MSAQFYLAVVRMPNTHRRMVTTTATSPRNARENVKMWMKNGETIERLYVEAGDWRE